MDIIRENNVYFNEKVIAWEDVLFVISYLNHVSSVYYIDRVLYTYYHYGQANIASSLSYKGYMDFKHTVNKAKEILESSTVISKKRTKRLYGNALSEYAIWSIFNTCRRIKSFFPLYSTIYDIVYDNDVHKNIIYYTQKHNDNYKIIPWLVKRRLVLLIIIIFKIQITLYTFKTTKRRS